MIHFFAFQGCLIFPLLPIRSLSNVGYSGVRRPALLPLRGSLSFPNFQQSVRIRSDCCRYNYAISK
jgi:hypothetical protein